VEEELAAAEVAVVATETEPVVATAGDDTAAEEAASELAGAEEAAAELALTVLDRVAVGQAVTAVPQLVMVTMVVW
jgi:hypothetical protein